MKKVRKSLAALLALVFTVFSLTFAFPVSAAAGAASGAEIVGIDYSRITQKADHSQKSYPVELKLGDVTFNGELFGEVGLTMEELNAVIRQTLEEKDLTPERVALVKKIAERVQNDAKLYWGDQVVSGLLSYLPIPGTIFSVGDYYEYVVHDDLGSAAFSAKKDAAQNAAKKGLETALKAGGRIGRVAKGAKGLISEVPLLGQLANTAIVADSWLDGSKRFDAYLELLEENLAIINDFYSACSRRAADLAGSKDMENTWKIKFDKNKNYRTYSCTFWGISGNMMSCELSGTLQNSSGGMEGTYTGTLWLDFEAVDLSPVEKNLENTPGLAAVKSLIYSMGGYHKTSDTGGKTALKCESQGQLTFYVSGTEGTVKPNVVGSLSGDKEVRFSFDRHLEWHDDTMAALGAQGVTEATFTSDDIASVTMESSSRVTQNGAVKTHQDSTEVFSQDPGTIFAPLESDPVITIHFSK